MGQSVDIRAFVFVAMIFCHIIDDYYLQGILANLKQSNWWKEHYPQDMYKFDYIIALIMHSISWSFMISLPIVLINWGCDISWDAYMICFIFNVTIHAITDHSKANKLKINLWTDQLIHLGQIIMTYIFIVYYGPIHQ